MRAGSLRPSRRARLPNCVRGRPGVVDAVRPACVLPDVNARVLGGRPRRVDSVRFGSREPWGPAAGPFAVAAGLCGSCPEAAPWPPPAPWPAAARWGGGVVGRSPGVLRTQALQRLLTERGLIGPAAPDGVITECEANVGPLDGAQVVAGAWSGPGCRRRLLEDGTAAIGELGFWGPRGERIVVVGNTAATRRVVGCPLCSCCPWPVLGLPPGW